VRRRHQKSRHRSSSSHSRSVERSPRRDRRERAFHSALAKVLELPKRKAFALVPRERPSDEGEPTQSPRNRALFLASPRNTRPRRDKFSDPEGDWSRELRAFSPERREEQAKRRAIAEAFIKAKEEQVEEEEPQQLKPIELKRVRRRKRKSINASKLADIDTTATCDDTSHIGKQHDSDYTPSKNATSIAQVADTSTEVSRQHPSKEHGNNSCAERARLAVQTSAEAATSKMDDVCWSDVEELLDQCSQNASSGDSDVEVMHDARYHPPEEVARLLEELAMSAKGFDAGDYWIDGAWDVEGLREDVEQLHQEQHICEESRSRNHTCTNTVAENEPDKTSAQRSESPEPDYPIFLRPQPMKLSSLEPQIGNRSSLPRGTNRHAFAKRRRKPISDLILAWQLRKLLRSSDQEV